MTVEAKRCGWTVACSWQRCPRADRPGPAGLRDDLDAAGGADGVPAAGRRVGRPGDPDGGRPQALSRVGVRGAARGAGRPGAGPQLRPWRLRITLSWGSSKLATELGLAGHQGPVAVIGAGVMGLSTARLVQEAGLSGHHLRRGAAARDDLQRRRRPMASVRPLSRQRGDAGMAAPVPRRRRL